MINSDHGSPNSSKAKLMGQSERLWCLCFIFSTLHFPLQAEAAQEYLLQDSLLTLSNFPSWFSITFSLVNCKQYALHAYHLLPDFLQHTRRSCMLYLFRPKI